MKYDSAKLAEAIKKAAEAAQVHANDDDGGTCNFDSAFLRVKGMPDAQAKEIEQLSGVRNYITNHSLFGRIIMLSGSLRGQGNRRTRMAEAMRRSLEEQGIDCGCYYAMD